jgi:hypothetical protein
MDVSKIALGIDAKVSVGQAIDSSLCHWKPKSKFRIEKAYFPCLKIQNKLVNDQNQVLHTQEWDILGTLLNKYNT